MFTDYSVYLKVDEDDYFFQQFASQVTTTRLGKGWMAILVIGLFMASVRLNHTVSKICVNSIIQISLSPKYGQ